MTEIRGISTAAGGTVLTHATAVVYIPVPRIIGHGILRLNARNFASSALVARYLLNPRMVMLITNDGGATFTDVSDALADVNTATNMAISALKTLGKGGAIYIGTPFDIGGLVVDVGTVNAVAAVLGVHFWNGSAWTAVSGYTDNTITAGVTMAKDGTVVWTPPTTSVPARLADIANAAPLPALQEKDFPLSTVGQYLFRDYRWYRLSVTNAADTPLTSPSTILQILSINKSTAYAEMVASDVPVVEVDISTEPGESEGISCIQADTDTGTGNLIANLEAEGFV